MLSTLFIISLILLWQTAITRVLDFHQLFCNQTSKVASANLLLGLLLAIIGALGSWLPEYQAAIRSILLYLVTPLSAIFLLQCALPGKLPNWNRNDDLLSLQGFTFLVLMTVPAVVTIGGCPVSGSNFLDLGDVTTYIGAARTLLKGESPAERFFILDYHGGELAYLGAFPLPQYIAAGLICVLGVEDRSFQIFNFVSGVTIVWSILRGRELASAPRSRFFAVAIFLGPLTFALIAFGAHVLSSSLAVYLVASSLFFGIRSRFLSGSIGLIYAVLYRPESFLFSLAFVLVYSSVIVRRSPKVWMGLLLILSIFLFVFLASFNFSLVSDRIVSSTSLAYIVQTSESTLGLSFGENWNRVNHQLTLRNLGITPATPLTRSDNAALLLTNPYQTVLFVAQNALPRSLEAFGQLRAFPFTQISISISMVFGLILLMSRAHTLFMCYLFCLLGLILVNFASGPRHFIGIYAILCEVVTIGVSRFIEHSKIVQRVRLFPFVRTGLLPPAILLLIMIPTVTILPTLWNIRSQDYYCYYPTIWTYVKSSLPIDGVAATQSPQLTFATTGYSAVGGTWLHRYINLIRRKFYPDVILIVADASRKHFSYARRRVGKLSSYRFAMSCHVEGTDFRFLILSRKGLVNTHPGQCRVLK